MWSSGAQTTLLTRHKLAEAFKAERCHRLRKEKKKEERNPLPPVQEGKFSHFIFHFHYLPAESINARRIREITWTLAFPALVLIHPWVHPPLFLSLLSSIFSHPQLPYCCRFALSVPTVSPSLQCRSPTLWIHQSLIIMSELLPSLPRSPALYSFLYFCISPRIFF